MSVVVRQGAFGGLGRFARGCFRGVDEPQRRRRGQTTLRRIYQETPLRIERRQTAQGRRLGAYRLHGTHHDCRRCVHHARQRRGATAGYVRILYALCARTGRIRAGRGDDRRTLSCARSDDRGRQRGGLYSAGALLRGLRRFVRQRVSGPDLFGLGQYAGHYEPPARQDRSRPARLREYAGARVRLR